MITAACIIAAACMYIAVACVSITAACVIAAACVAVAGFVYYSYCAILHE